MTKGTLRRSAPIAGIVAAAATACGVGGYIIARWPTLDVALKPSVISGAFTILAAMGGALVVFWQLRRQAENTIRANRHNEMMKLKKEVYIEILLTCKTAMEGNRALHQFVTRFRSDLWAQKYMEGQRHRFPVPDARSMKWLQLKADAEDKTRAIIPLINRWKIIDPRLDVVSLALESALYDVEQAQNKMTVAMIHMPNNPLPHQIEPDWTVPDDKTFGLIQEVLNDVDDALALVADYISDFQQEMQNALLGELFDRELPPRLTTTKPAIELGKHVALAEYFKTQTAWGTQKPKPLSTRDPISAATPRDLLNLKGS